MILLIDNYDSFAHNLARYLRRLGCEVRCERNDAIDVGTIASMEPRLIVMSPGPCTPDEAGCCLEVVRELSARFPMLGVCLGHQVIAQGFGGTVVRASEPIHGMSSRIEHDGAQEFHGVPNPFTAGRYHSLVASTEDLPECLNVTAKTAEGVIMGLRHATLPIFGWQFHPESILTECGYELLANLLGIVGLEVSNEVPSIASERTIIEKSVDPYPTRPITF